MEPKKTPSTYPQIVVGTRVYSKGNAEEGVVIARKVQLGDVRWDDGRTENMYLSTLGVVGDAEHAMHRAREGR